MKKINWFKRLFYTWDKLSQYFSNDDEKSKEQGELIEFVKKTNASLEKDKETLAIKVKELEDSLKIINAKNEEKEKSIQSKTEHIANLEKSISETKAILQERTGNVQKVQEEINTKLSTLGRIENTFFAATGNKGKGELGEMQVKTVLEKSGLSPDFWVENLAVGSKVVEFAIKSGEENKWIPIDSKVLDAKVDENNKMIIDADYTRKIKTQAQSISSYLNKPNTTGYGVLVLQNDSILMELYDNFPNLFKEVLRDQKVYIASPSSFIQMAWSISQIVDIYERVKGDEAIYTDMMSTLDSVANFAKSLKETHVKFNTAMERHFPAIENKHKNLAKRLDKTGKLKQISKEEDNA